ncbi:MAG: SNF2 helicase associated domain-containing protein, partial [Gammaproteobacteria bacterium]|nr:SNF2 helicase associated domain-containing protein [Gammaproteobacteria bacterium]
MFIPINENNIKANVSSAYFQRGLDYYHQNRVTHLSQNSSDHILHGKVTGRGKTYRQEVTFNEYGGQWRFYGSCSCPLSENCKHVVALLLEALERTESATPSTFTPSIATATAQTNSFNLEMWQQKMASALIESRPLPSPIKTAQTGLVYSLSQQQNSTNNRLNLNAYKTRRLLKGGYGVRQAISLDEIYDSYKGHITPIDRQIADRLINDHRYSYGNDPVAGEDGAIALRQLLETQRCYYGDISGSAKQHPLRFGEDVSAHFDWIEHPDESKSLHIRLENHSHGLIAPTLPPFYIDPQSGLCGEIDQPLNDTLFLQLLNLPTLTPAEQKQVSLMFNQLHISEIVPPPVELQQILIDQPVRAQLTLSRLSEEFSNAHSARLEFDYGEILLGGDKLRSEPRSTLMRYDNVYQIQRDLQGEEQILQRLAQFGFAANRDDQDEMLELVIPADSRQDSAFLWQKFIIAIPELEAEGWIIDSEDSVQMRFEQIEQIDAHVKADGHDWFNVGMSIKIGK